MDEQQSQFADDTTGNQAESGSIQPHSAPTTGRRLYRSSDQRILLGVCGGLGEYFDIDPVLVRVVFAVLTVVGGSGVLLYAVLAIIMPSEQHLETHPRDAARATLDEAVGDTKQAVNRASTWVREKTGRSGSDETTA